jgi:endonuclease/exonuclease/phosphatase family metal-dependent hydrolase
MRVMSFNIWSDQAPNMRWRRRRDFVAGILRWHHPDSAGLQEATADMVADLEARLPELRWIGVGRDDGRTRGEFNPIFYRKDRLEAVAHGTFWLAADCSVPGRGWDAFCHRIVTWAHFKDQTNESELFHFNTHLDHFGRKARREGARLLLKKIAEIAGEAPVVVTGDFNCRENSRTYQLLTRAEKGGKDEVRPLRDSFLESAQPPHGPRKTWRGIRPGGLGSGRIDYIFVQNKCRVLHYGVLSDRTEIGYPSDHFPVVADVEIATAANER